MNPGFVVLMGISTVFVGLICIIFVCKIMSFLVNSFQKKPADEVAKVPAGNAVAAQASEIPNREEFVAAVSAAIAENLGKDVSGIRILSIKKL